ncbi:MAG: hypothetical protein NC420_03965 [Eubacterium sp.]|nr:hypothetical protein [Eubacterium sp.]
MKICYIITPFENTDYLIRCINSLYRQLDNNFDVILAENDFAEKNDELQEFLSEKKQVIRISDKPKSNEDKLNEAIKLLPEDSDYVMLIDVNTVIAPIAARAISNCEKSDMIIPAAAIRCGDEFLLDNPDSLDLINNIENYSPYNVCFGRKLFAGFSADYLQNQKNFSFFILGKYLENPIINTIKDVCIYTEKYIWEEERAGIERLLTIQTRIVDSLDDIKNVKVKYAVIDKIIDNILEFLQIDVKNEDKISAFTVLQNLCRRYNDLVLFNKIVEHKTGCKTEEIISFNLDEYELFKSLYQMDNNSLFAAARLPVADEILPDIVGALEEIKEDIAVIKSEQKTYTIPIATSPTLGDPVQDVPRLYREGRLGFRTIWSSFKGWLGYKMGKNR